MMQPSFLPWQGYFELIYRAERFVFADDFQFSRKSFHQRNRLFLDIRKAKVDWYSVPILQGSYQLPLNRVRIAEAPPWRRKMWRQICGSYSRTEYFPRLAGPLEKWLLTPFESLAAQNIAFIQAACELMGMVREFRTSSSRPSSLPRSQRALDLLHWCEADTYLSPRGSFGYLKPDGLFPVEGITVLFQDFRPRPYTQTGLVGEFVPYLSVLDALFNVGPEATLQLIRYGTPKWLTWDEMMTLDMTAPSHDEGAGSEEA